MLQRWTSPAQRRWAFWLCMASVLALCLMPPAQHLPSTGWDKANHALGFAVLAVLGLAAYPARTARVLAGLLAFGALIEVLQSLTGYRTAEWLDLLADGAGLAAGWPLARWSGVHRPAAAG
ncbi:VanZ family protein [Ramlibacter sp. RBP-2]|uniref:VanZ family protein n=1 Tax=Ramlibacter lithotrophicus TaxID=2606681 RepID=A0A7X6I4Z7_9BURK|nr:VanZ family protein [Ramlibacter lithotrophicus]NKE64808.1 VanZ family protein [Ramlibacter lithotrophicus]